MKYVNKSDLTEILSEEQLRNKLCTVSLPNDLTKEALDYVNFAELPVINFDNEANKQEPNNRLVIKARLKEDGTYERFLDRVPLDEEMIIVKNDFFSKKIRKERDLLLAESDKLIFKFIETGGVVPASITVYRQKLRDITMLESFPFNIVFLTLD